MVRSLLPVSQLEKQGPQYSVITHYWDTVLSSPLSSALWFEGAAASHCARQGETLLSDSGGFGN